jgi:hypothetical protein
MAGQESTNPPRRSNVTPILIGAFGVALLVLLVYVGDQVWTANQVCSSRFPPRATRLDDYWVVFATILAFVLGHASARVPVLRRHRAVTDRAATDETGVLHSPAQPLDDEVELGDGHPTGPVVAVNFAATTFLMIVTFAVGWEAYSFKTLQWPITYFARCATFFGPEISLGVAVIWAFVIGRLLWVFTGPIRITNVPRPPLPLPFWPTSIKLLVVTGTIVIVVFLGRHFLEVGRFPNVGSAFASALFIGVVVAFTLFSAFFNALNPRPIGSWIQAWARRFPILAFLLATVLGMLVGHVYWSTQPLCPVVVAGQASSSEDLDCRLAPTPSASP